MRQIRFATYTSALGIAFSMPVAYAQAQSGESEQIHITDGPTLFIPSRNVEFKTVVSDPNFALPATQVDYPHCLTDGSLVLHTIDWDAVKRTP